jgi:hypothetical protein
MKWKRRCELRQDQRTARLRIPGIALLHHSGTDGVLGSNPVFVGLPAMDECIRLPAPADAIGRLFR